MTEAVYRRGYAALVGRPNAGKSTLLNALAGGKRSIVSRRAQTTRGVVRALRDLPDARIIFLDTPGWQDRRLDSFNRRLNRGAERAAREADVLVFTVASLSWTSADAKLLSRLPLDRPVIAAITKVDLAADRDLLLPFISELSSRRDFAALVPVSGLRGDYVEDLAREIGLHLPPSPRGRTAEEGRELGGELGLNGVGVGEGEMRLEFVLAERLREKLFARLGAELPYGLGVVARAREEGNLLRVDAEILVERESHKRMVIGRGGEALKRAATAARREMELLTGRKVYLTTRAKAREWRDNPKLLREMGVG